MSIEPRFIDGIGQVAVINGMARIELTVLNGLNTESPQQSQVVSSQLVMPIDAFLRLHQACQKVVEQLEGKGVIKRREAAAAPQGKSTGKSAGTK
jgi:hypothetical protein